MAGTDIVQVKPHLFQKGHAKMGGRQKGSKNRFASSGWHARSPAAPRRRALPGQDYARTDELLRGYDHF
jgi:hypothetical protein